MQSAFSQYYSRPDDETFTNFPDWSANIHGRNANSSAQEIPTNNLEFQSMKDMGLCQAISHTPDFENDQELALVVNNNPVAMTNYGFSSITSRIAPGGGRYLKTLPAPIAAQALNYSAQTYPKEELLGLFRGHDTHDEFRAFTSTQYGRIWDSQIVDAVSNMLQDHPEFTNPPTWKKDQDGNTVMGGLYASDRDMYGIFIDGGSIVDAGWNSLRQQHDTLHRGFIVSNSEVGHASFELQMFLFRAICGNHSIWGQEQTKTIKIRHNVNAPDQFAEQAVPLIMNHAQASVSGLETGIKKAKEHRIPVEEGEVAKWLQTQGYTAVQARNGVLLAKSEEGKCDTFWDIHQGLTAYARQMTHMDSRTALEKKSTDDFLKEVAVELEVA